jgi:ABC-2 type transport system ATP-binding protein
LSEAVVSLSKVNKRLGQRTVLKNVSFDVERGDVFGYLGPNGAGKTTSIRVLLGLLKPDSGGASVLGKDVAVDRNRGNIGFVLESDGLYDNLSALDNLAYYAAIYRVPQPGRRLDDVLSQVKLRDRAREKVGAYSKGMRQRLALARAILHDPEILILDEPTAGVDPTGQIEVRELVQEMSIKRGKTVLFSSHNLDEVQRVCNRIALIDRGEIKLYGRLDELQKSMGTGEVIIESREAVAEDTVQRLRGQAGVATADAREKQLTLTFEKGRADVPKIVSFLVSAGIGIEQVRRREASLEEIYTTILKAAEKRP